MSHFIKRMKEITFAYLGTWRHLSQGFDYRQVNKYVLGCLATSWGLLNNSPIVREGVTNNMRSSLYQGDNCLTQWIESIQTQIAT